MADQANRKSPPFNSGPASDDPLMELSRIVGVDEDLDLEAAEPDLPPEPSLSQAPAQDANQPPDGQTPAAVQEGGIETVADGAADAPVEPAGPAPDNDAANLDLEDALMAELGDEAAMPAATDATPSVETGSDAPMTAGGHAAMTAEWQGDDAAAVAGSDEAGAHEWPRDAQTAPEGDVLEQELAAMLGEAEPDAPDVQTGSGEIALPSFDDYLSQSAEDADPASAVNGAAPLTADNAPIATGDAPAFEPGEPSVEDPAADAADLPSEDLIDEAELEAAIADQSTDIAAPAAHDDDDLEAVFQDVFDAALDDEPTLADVEAAPRVARPEADPVEELAEIMGVGAAALADDGTMPTGSDGDRAAMPDESDIDASLAGLDAVFEHAVDQSLSERGDAFAQPPASEAGGPPPQLMSVDEPPIIETVDMDAFNTDDPPEFDVPELPAEPAQASVDTSAATAEATPGGTVADAKVAAAASVFAAAGASARADGDVGLDETDFEAELARDMEFVGHDMQAARGQDRSAFFDDEAFDDPVEDNVAGKRGSAWRGLAIGGVLGLIAIVGVGAAMLLNNGDDTTAGPVLVEAGDEPVKIVPDDPGGQTVPNQDRAVFDDGAQTPSQETLVTTAEEPIDIATAPGDAVPSALGTDGKSEDRLTGGGTETAAADEGIETITPRRVRTLIVRPDGTLEERPSPPQREPQQIAVAPEAVRVAPVEQPDASAPGTEAPVAEATAPTQSGEGELAERFGEQPVAEPANEVAVAPDVAAPEASLPAVAERPAAEQPVAATPEPAPAPQPPAQQVAVTPAGAASGFTVQLAALPSEAEARTTATNLSQRYGNLIAGRGLSIQRAVIDGRGTFYRVRVAASGRDDANTLCNQIQAVGGNCFVAR